MVKSMKDFASRKFILTILGIGTAFYLVLIGKSIAEYTAALGVILGFYQGANVAEKYIESKASKEREP